MIQQQIASQFKAVSLGREEEKRRVLLECTVQTVSGLLAWMAHGLMLPGTLYVCSHQISAKSSRMQPKATESKT